VNEIFYAKKAARQLRKLAPPDSAMVRHACRNLENMLNCTHVKALINHAQQYRLRVGNFRVFFDFDGAAHIVSIEEVRKRDDRTYN